MSSAARRPTAKARRRTTMRAARSSAARPPAAARRPSMMRADAMSAVHHKPLMARPGAALSARPLFDVRERDDDDAGADDRIEEMRQNNNLLEPSGWIASHLPCVPL